MRTSARQGLGSTVGRKLALTPSADSVVTHDGARPYT